MKCENEMIDVMLWRAGKFGKKKIEKFFQKTIDRENEIVV